MNLLRSAVSLVGWFVLAGQCAMLQSVAAATLSLKPVADACLFEHDPNNNLGASVHVAAGTIRTGQRSRALYRFDFSQIPTNAVVESVLLSLKVVMAPPGGPSSMFGLNRMLKNWTEGAHSGQQGAAAGTSEVTWNSRAHAVSLWSTPGGAPGTDFVTTASQSHLIAGNGAYSFSSTSGGLVDDVQAWVSNSSTNHGWMLLGQAERLFQSARRFATREDGANAPVLVISYSVPVAPTPPVITQQPKSQKVPAGSNVEFAVAASGTEPLGYQWFKNDGLIQGATSATLSLSTVSDADAARYRVDVSNAGGKVSSDSVALTLLRPPTPVKLLSISIDKGLFQFGFDAEIETLYQVLSRANFQETPWEVVTNIVVPEAKRVVISSTLENTTRFFVVKAGPPPSP